VPLARLFAGNPDKGMVSPLDDIIAYKIMLLMFANTSTTATTLTYLFFELALHPA
jgi:cytochrome P450